MAHPYDDERGQAARIHPESLAVDALPDDARTGTHHQDETDAVQDTTGELREIDE
jgi:hypothetical protein